MRQFKPGQLQSGSLYPITASFALTASYTLGLDTGSLTTTASFNAFTSSYTTGSFTGSFKGDGSQLTGIVSSKWTGSNPISRESDVEITGSLRVQGSITGSLFGTASVAETVNINSTNINNSYSLVFSQNVSGPSLLRADSNSSIIYNPSTNILVLGANASSPAGQLLVTGSIISTQGITGSLFGTSSWANNAVTASYIVTAQTASYVTASGIFGPYGSNSIISASSAVTASYALQSLSSSYANFATSASHALFAETASNALNAQDILIYVLNNSGYNIPKGTVVHITASGNSSDTPRIISASYENDANSANTLGIANESIANGANGYVMTEGVLKGIDTSAFISGQMIYLGATGSIIGSAPQAPLHAVRIGQVVRAQSNNGSVYVRIDNGYELDELHDVRIMTASLHYGDLLMRSGSVWTNTKQLSGSYGLTGSLTATSITASGLYAGATYISGSLIVNGQSTFYGTASFVNVTASNLFVSESFISVNVFEPAERFGGLKVYDSGSSAATASLAWDSLHNHWVYQNVDGLTYTGGMLLAGPRNTGSLGDEPNLTKWFVPRSDGGDHLDDSQIYSSGSVTQITGSLTVTSGVTASFTGSYAGDGSGLNNIPASGIVGLNLSQIASGSVSASISPDAGLQVNTNVTATSFTGSLFGTASWADQAVTASFVQTAQTASYVVNAISSSFATSASFSVSSSQAVTSSFALTASFVTASNVVGTVTSASFAVTASYLIGGVTIDTGSLVTTASFNAYTGSAASQFAGTASFAVTASFLAGAATTVTYIRRSDYTASLDANVNLLYLGEAVSGSAESATVWDITRLSISSSGATTPNSASGVAWTDRYTTIYS